MSPAAPPRVPGLPILGNTLAILRDPTAFLVDAYERLGPAFRVSAFGQPYTVMAGREALEFLRTVGEQHFSRATFYQRFAHELGAREFILGVQGDRHRQLRKTMQLGFSRQVAGPYVASMIEEVRKRAGTWRVGRPVRVPDLMAALAFDAYSLVMAGRPLPEYFQDALVYSETIMRVGAQVRPPLLLSLPRYRRAKRRVFGLMRGLLQEHRAHGGDPEREFDVFHALLDATREDQTAFTDADIIATALYGFVGSLVYLNRVLSYLLYELLKDPQLREEAIREADAFFASGNLTSQGLRQMPTLRHAYLETLRFHPVALGLPFLVEEDFDFCGSRIRKGDRVVLTPLPVHFSTKVYANPHRFDSGRCAEPRREIHAAGAFAPFGFAGRVCAAVGLVEIIGLATTATLLHVADWRLEPPDYTVTTRVNPLPGPESRFTIRMIGLRTPKAAASALPQPDDVLTAPSMEWSSPAWTELLARVESVRYERGALIIREGDVAAQFFIVTEGQVEVFKHLEPDGERLLATLGAGDYFGEIGLLRRVRRTASVRATTAVRALVVDRETFVGMISESDVVSEQIAEMVRRRTTATRLSDALPHLDRDRLGRLLPNVRLTRYAAGTTIIRQGDTADAFFVVARGRVEVVVQRGPSSHEHVLQELAAGEWFGEAGILQGTPRTATVRVTSGADAEVLVLLKDDFQSLMNESAATRTDVLTMMSRRLEALEDRLNR